VFLVCFSDIVSFFFICLFRPSGQPSRGGQLSREGAAVEGGAATGGGRKVSPPKDSAASAEDGGQPSKGDSLVGSSGGAKPLKGVQLSRGVAAVEGEQPGRGAKPALGVAWAWVARWRGVGWREARMSPCFRASRLIAEQFGRPGGESAPMPRGSAMAFAQGCRRKDVVARMSSQGPAMTFAGGMHVVLFQKIRDGVCWRWGCLLVSFSSCEAN
jgi:hypothetical protein